ncbi:MAG: TAT-variant-translocated molybdopterin oxidoreductase, partial [Bacteroidota bacterium]
MKNQKQNKEVWVGVEQLENDPAYLASVEREFSDDIPTVIREEALNLGASRRDFLKYLGFSLGAATVAASCDIPVKKAIPYVVKPDEIVPGVATYYASSFVRGGDYCAVLVKTREGRPIKIEGNPLSGVTKGGTSARAQASVLSLYDTSRYKSPMKKAGDNWEATSWADVDKTLVTKLTPDAQIRIVTNTILSPTAKKAMGEFLAKYPNAKVVTYDPVSSSALLEANEQNFAKKTVPSYHFDKADVIVSFGADFLGTWISPVEFAKQWVTNRKVDAANPKMSRHIQVESGMTLTGSNADNRILVKPSEMGAAIAFLYNELGGGVTAPKLEEAAAAALRKVAAELKAASGKALVVSSSNNLGEQVLVNAINSGLDSFGNTITFANASMQRQGIDKDVQDLIREMNGGTVNALLVWGANPAYDLPNSDKFRAGMEKVATKISFATVPDETTALCDWIAPNHHYLESWGDAEPKENHFSLIQPTIAPLFQTRQAEETLLRWANSANLNALAEQPYYEYLRANWQATMFPKQSSFGTFNGFWDSTLHDGVFEVPIEAFPEFGWDGDVNAAAAKISKPGTGLEVSFYETVNVGAGQYADNPWLIEMPDPVTRSSWSNYFSIPIEFDGNRRFHGQGDFKGLNESEYFKEADQIDVTITANGLETKNKVTCIRQFGQKHDTAAIALGYGRSVTGICGKNVGVNAFPWLTIDANGNTQYWASGAQVSKSVGTDKEFTTVQYHHTMGVKGKGEQAKLNVDEMALMTLGKGFQGSLVDRSILRQANLPEVKKFVEELHHEREHHEHLNDQSLYPYDKYVDEKYKQGHHWGMHIDLNACIGCGTCTVACMSENNVPVVGKHEVYRHHEMTWLRIDRYFYG